VTDAVNTLEGSARAKGVTLSVDLQPDLPPAHADPTRLQQILIILGDNAIKFTPAGGAATIQVRLLPEDPEFLLVEVSDTGIGIRPEMTERVFERLYQASEHTAASRKGLGLGLHICKELVTRQGGKIWAKRRLEQGSTFAFTLPVFSLSSVIAPLLKNDQWPTESVALVTVDLRLLNAWPSKESREEWSKEARGLVHRCLMPDLDVLLPKTSSDTQEERFFVTAFGDEEGVAILTNRIREQFAGLPRLKQADATVAVSYTMLPPASRGAGASTDKIVKGMATRFEAAIKSHVTPEAYHE
jgi:hypothetical protein